MWPFLKRLQLHEKRESSNGRPTTTAPRAKHTSFTRRVMLFSLTLLRPTRPGAWSFRRPSLEVMRKNRCRDVLNSAKRSAEARWRVRSRSSGASMMSGGGSNCLGPWIFGAERQPISTIRSHTSHYKSTCCRVSPMI